MPTKTFKRLCERQKNLKELEIGPTTRPYASLLKKNPTLFFNLSHVTKLHFYPAGEDDLHTCSQALKTYPLVKELTIFLQNRKLIDTLDENAQGNDRYYGTVFKGMFNHMLPPNPSNQIKLSQLRLGGIQLRYAQHSYVEVIDFTSLETLNIGCDGPEDDCGRPEDLFLQLRQPLSTPSNLRLLGWFRAKNTETHVLEAFEDVLEHLPTLTALNVSLKSVERLPKSGLCNSLAQH